MKKQFKKSLVKIGVLGIILKQGNNKSTLEVYPWN